MWRFSSGEAETLTLREESYETARSSLGFPALSSETLALFVERGLTEKRPAWAREVREWASSRN